MKSNVRYMGLIKPEDGEKDTENYKRALSFLSVCTEQTVE